MKKNFLLALIVFILLLLVSCGVDREQTSNNKERILINETGFETGVDESAFTMNSWKSEGFNLTWVQGFDVGRAHIDTEYAHTGNNSLRIDYPADAEQASFDSGAQAPLTFNPKEEVYVSYWLRFSDNFQWGRIYEGGKLPGLASGDLCSGGAICDGTNGFTARLMWREGGSVVLYLYHMDNPDPSVGEDFNLVTGDGQVYFERGRWYNVVQRVKINTGNNNNGQVQIWIDGKEALMLNNIRFVNDGSLVDTFYFSTFHGGWGIEWGPIEDVYIWFDDIKIYYF